MPRKSAASREISKPVKRRGAAVRLDPPYELGKEEVAVWRTLVDSKPADWFDLSHVDIMASYCRYVVRLREIRLEAQEIKIGKKTVRDQKYIKNLHKDEILYTDKMMKLARSMRLTQSSVGHPRTDGNRLKNDKAAILASMQNYRVDDDSEDEDETESESAFERA